MRCFECIPEPSACGAPCYHATILMEGKGCNRACTGQRHKKEVVNKRNSCHLPCVFFSIGYVIEQQQSAAADAALGSGARKASVAHALDMESGWDGKLTDLAKNVALRLIAGPLGRAPVVKGDEAVVDALGTLLACMQSCLYSQSWTLLQLLFMHP